MRFIFSIALIIISVIVFFTVTNPLRSSVSELRTQVATYNVALDNSTELQKTRDGLARAYSSIKEEDRDRLEHFLPNTVNNIKFILEVERIASLHSMSIKNIKFQTERPQDTKTLANGKQVTVTASDPQSNMPYGVFPIEFSTEGNYDTFVSFLKDLEHNLRLIDIKSIGFSVPQPGGGIDPSIYTYTIKVETYWLK